MRIVLVAETFLPATNGVVNCVLHIARELAAGGHTPVVVAPAGDPEWLPVIGRNPVPVRSVPATRVPGYSFAAAVLDLLSDPTRRCAARAAAETFPWERSVRSMRGIHAMADRRTGVPVAMHRVVSRDPVRLADQTRRLDRRRARSHAGGS